jgi:hypothetical protein
MLMPSSRTDERKGRLMAKRAKMVLEGMDFASLVELRQEVEQRLQEYRRTLENQLGSMGSAIASLPVEAGTCFNEGEEGPAEISGIGRRNLGGSRGYSQMVESRSQGRKED